jgi:hypothetical protein
MINGRTVALCAALLLAGCHGSDSNQAPTTGVSKLPTKAPVAAKTGPTPEELTAGMVEAVGVGKSSVPVALKFDLPTRPEVGQPLEIVLGVLPHEPASAASLKVSGSEGLQPAPGNTVVEVGAVDPAEAYRVTVMVTPTAEGVQFLAVEVGLKHDDVTDARSFSIPIIVQGAAETAGAAAPAAAATIKH